MIAEYKCLNTNCGCEFNCKPKPVTCPVCQHLYIKWVNFDKDFQTKEKGK